MNDPHENVFPTTPVADTDPTVPEDLARLQKLADDHLDGWKRAKADYLNLKKQTDVEKQQIAQFAVAQTILKFLPIYDNLARAIEHIPADEQNEEWAKGISHIQSMFVDGLKKMGLELIPTVGHQFDPARHHAVTKVKKEGAKPGTIVTELKAGFMAEDRVLEPAHVTVAE